MRTPIALLMIIKTNTKNAQLIKDSTQTAKMHKQPNREDHSTQSNEKEESEHQRERVFSALAEQKLQSELIPLWRRECTIKTGIELSKHYAGCQPRPTVIEISEPKKPWLITNKIIIHKCNGGCIEKNINSTCKHTSSKPITIPVVTIDRGCGKVKVTNHTGCECVCNNKRDCETQSIEIIE